MPFNLNDAREILGDQFVRAELGQELNRIAADRREAERYSGASYAGFRPDPRPARDIRQCIEDGLAKKAAARLFNASPRGQFIAALDRLAAAAPGPEDRARAEYSRNLADDRQPVNVSSVAVIITILNVVEHPAARDAIDALAELLLEQRRAA